MKTRSASPLRKRPFFERVKHELASNWCLYLMLIPVFAFYILFKYLPMSKMVIAFQKFNLYKGIAGSQFVGFANFEKFFKLRVFWRLIRNTLLLSLYSIIFAFPLPIILALMMNEIKHSAGKKLVQTVSYMPHFISMVVVCGLLRNFCSSEGIINVLISKIVPSWEFNNLLGVKEYYRTIHIASSIWQEMGWDSIIYLATLAGVDPQLYEAAYIDGATKFKRIIHVTLPSLVPIISVKFIMRVGQVMSVGSEKILLLYNESIYETADVIATYMYRDSLLKGNYDMGAAVGVFNTVISIVILVFVNTIFRRLTEDSLW